MPWTCLLPSERGGRERNLVDPFCVFAVPCVCPVLLESGVARPYCALGFYPWEYGVATTFCVCGCRHGPSPATR
jgi:hypothetical protein